MKSKYSTRIGEGNLRGALNPKITVSEFEPVNPKIKDLWYDISGTPVWKYWNGSSWI